MMEYLDIKVTKKILPPISNTFILSNLNESVSYSELKADYDHIQDRVNNLVLKNKSELIYLCLILYKLFLDAEEPIPEKEELFSFSFYNKISRIFVYSKDKITSFYMPFQPKDENGTRTLESKLNRSELISIDELIFLIEYFKHSMFLFFEKTSLLEQAEKIETIKGFLSEDTMGFKLLDEEKLSRLISELLYYDSSYLRYDIDLEHALDENKEVKRERVFKHPPYHIDSDYRDSPSYKIGFDKKLTNSEFLKMFQIEITDPALIIKDNYKPERLLADVQQYKNSLDHAD